METDVLKAQIDALIAEIGEEQTIARPVQERAVLSRIQDLLESTRAERTAGAKGLWEAYLPYAAKLCTRLSKLEEGWQDQQDYFASENAQFWLDLAAGQVERGDIPGAEAALGQIIEATRLVRADQIFRVQILIEALELALELSDKKRATLLFEEADKVYHRLAGSDAYTGSAWLGKIKKLGKRLQQGREKLRRYFQYAEAISVSLEAGSEADLEKVVNYLQQNLGQNVKITRRPKEADGESGRFRARIKITLE